MNKLHINFLKAVHSLELKFPASTIAKRTGYGVSIVSEYLNSKKEVSEAFAEKFCKAYGFDLDEMKTGAGEKLQALAKDTGKTHEKKPIRQAIKDFLLSDWINAERNAKEIEELAEVIRLLEEKNKDAKKE